MEDEEISKKLLQDYEEFKKEEADKKAHEYYVSKNYSNALASQLSEQEKRKLEESKQIARDKELIDKIVQKVYEEDEK